MRNDDFTIIARGLTKRFGDFTAVDGIDFQVRRGEIFGFLGPNGAGKTTTIRMMLGLLKPTAGTVSVLGVAVAEHPERIRPRIGYMAQRFSLYDDLTILQNLRFYGRAYGLDNDVLHERIQNAIQTAGLEGREHTHAKDLSGGWRQRLALNAAILHRPELVFLDEPTAGVDPVSRRAFWNLLYQLVADGVTVFVTTHYMDEAEHCHRLAFIQHGRLIAYGMPEEIKRDRMRGQVLEIDCTQPDVAIGLLREMGSFEEVALYGAQIHVVAEGITEYKSRIAQALTEAGVEVYAMDVITPSLEDVFISSVRNHVGSKE
ncbi:MAG: ABC transporter ATP-binding protein [Chloroflexi bacterium]|nr:MAG: ABC transporter ATP-binding protein [Chloroflexota bacterium]